MIELLDIYYQAAESKPILTKAQAQLFLDYLGTDFSQEELADYWSWSQSSVSRFLKVYKHKPSPLARCEVKVPLILSSSETYDHELKFTAKEHKKLEQLFGRKRLEFLASEILTWADDNPTKFKKRKSHYRMLLNWDRNATMRYGLVWMEDGAHGPGYYDEARLLRSLGS